MRLIDVPRRRAGVLENKCLKCVVLYMRYFVVGHTFRGSPFVLSAERIHLVCFNVRIHLNVGCGLHDGSYDKLLGEYSEIYGEHENVLVVWFCQFTTLLADAQKRTCAFFNSTYTIKSFC